MVDDASSSATIWADRFEHRHVELSTMEGEISSRLARAVITELIDREAAQGPSEDASHAADAQHSALRGWSALNRELWVPQDLAEARRWFDRALLADRSKASALAGVAYAIVAENIRATMQGRDLAVRDDCARPTNCDASGRASAGLPRAWFCRGDYGSASAASTLCRRLRPACRSIRATPKPLPIRPYPFLMVP